MVLSDFFKNIFSKRNSREEEDKVHDVGVTGLPRNIEEDFLRRIDEDCEKRNDYGNWVEDFNFPQQNYEIIIEPGCDGCCDENDELLNMSHGIFHQLDDMMKQMFGSFGSFNIEESFPDIGNSEGIFEHQPNEESRSLRDKMLKDPYDDDELKSSKVLEIPSQERGDAQSPTSMMDWSWTFPFGGNSERPMSNDRQDRDFDSEIRSGKSKLSDIFKKEDESHSSFDNYSGNGFSFSSVVTKKTADGIIQSQKTVKDSLGNEEVTVVRKIGDQEHKKRTVKDISGNEETTENLVNMDPDDLEKFEEAWFRSENRGEQIPQAMWNRDSKFGSAPSPSFFQSIKDLLFPWNRDE